MSLENFQRVILNEMDIFQHQTENNMMFRISNFSKHLFHIFARLQKILNKVEQRKRRVFQGNLQYSVSTILRNVEQLHNNNNDKSGERGDIFVQMKRATAHETGGVGCSRQPRRVASFWVLNGGVASGLRPLWLQHHTHTPAVRGLSNGKELAESNEMQIAEVLQPMRFRRSPGSSSDEGQRHWWSYPQERCDPFWNPN